MRKGKSMEIILFTKFLKGHRVEEIGEIARGIGVDGLDLAIRQGQCVNPENARDTLAGAVTSWQGYGLTVPMATLEGKWVDPMLPELQQVFAACGDAGIPCIKLGYWGWQPAQHYWDGVDAIRRSLDQFQQLGQRYGVCSLIHTHSGNYYASNASGAMQLVNGFDPRYVAVYLDPAHLALDGEYLPMGLDIVRDYLRMVGVKNARHVPVFSAKRTGWVTDFCALQEGLVNWKEAIRLLHGMGYDGPLSFHAEYTARESWPEAVRLAQVDIPFLKTCIAAVNEVSA